MLNKYFYLICGLFLLLMTCKKEEWLFDVMPDENLELPLLLDINEKPCALDMPSRTFRYPIETASISNFEALVEFQDYSRVKFNNVELLNGEINNFGDIEINKSYSLEFITHGESNKFNITFSSLPTLQIITKDKIINEPKSYARLIVNYTEFDESTVNTLIGIENRGASSLYNPKKSHGFKLLNSFDQKDIKSLPFFNQKSNSKWVLDAMYIDKAKGRNKMGMDLWQSFPNNIEHIGVPGGNYVELFHNHESMGLYCFHETLSYEFLELNPSSVLITGKKNLPDTYFQDLPNKSHASIYWGSWEQKIPDDNLANNWEAFEAMSHLIVEGTDEQFINEIANQIDLDNVIDYFLYVSISQAGDNMGKNWFFLKKSANDKFVIVPWDMDSTWGRDHTGADIGIGDLSKTGNGLFSRLINLSPNNFTPKLKARWELLKNDELSKSSLKSIFQNNLNILNQSDIIRIDNQKWNLSTDLVNEEIFLDNFINEKWEKTDYFISNL